MIFIILEKIVCTHFIVGLANTTPAFAYDRINSVQAWLSAACICNAPLCVA